MDVISTQDGFSSPYCCDKNNGYIYNVFVNLASVTISPGKPFDNRFSLASLLDFANKESPKPMSSMKESLEDKNPCQW